MVGRLIVSLVLAYSFLNPDPLRAQNYPNPSNYPSPSFGGGAAFYEDPLPEDQGWAYGDSRFDAFLKNVATSTWFRLEYLNWSYREPSKALLGSEILGIPDPRIPFPVTVSGTPTGLAQVADLSGVSLRDTPGIRGTVGLPLRVGTIEANIFAFGESRDTIVPGGLPSPVPPFGEEFAIVTSTLTDGKIGTNTFRYDRSFEAKFTSDLWGTEANYIFDPYMPGEGWKVRPLVGFRYLKIHERLTQVGEFDDLGRLLTPLRGIIDSDASNAVYAPQLGLRLEMVHRWFTVGVEPKIGFGVNSYKASVGTDNIRFEGDPFVTTKDSGTKFSPVGELDVYARVHVSDHFSLYVSYQMMIAGNITRPHDNILYDDGGVGASDVGIVLNTAYDNMLYQGISLGGEIRFR